MSQPIPKGRARKPAAERWDLARIVKFRLWAWDEITQDTWGAASLRKVDMPPGRIVHVGFQELPQERPELPLRRQLCAWVEEFENDTPRQERHFTIERTGEPYHQSALHIRTIVLDGYQFTATPDAGTVMRPANHSIVLHIFERFGGK